MSLSRLILYHWPISKQWQNLRRSSSSSETFLSFVLVRKNASFEHPWKPWPCIAGYSRHFIWRMPGYMAAYSTLQRAELESLSKVLPPTLSGVEQSEEVLEWIWNNFSAVAGDQPSFECWRRAFLLFKAFSYPTHPTYSAIFMLIPGFLIHSISATIPSARGSSRRVGLPDWRALWFRSVGWTVQEAGSIFIFCYEWGVQCEYHL